MALRLGRQPRLRTASVDLRVLAKRPSPHHAVGGMQLTYPLHIQSGRELIDDRDCFISGSLYLY